ncbi:MerR family transcriptional regulator [Fusobacterium sp.]|uniref:MerR family transcriptional regulator n=1 Tax=Fusobacterium sp. TaxID=68766 RepID=UPI0028FF31E7|nr:MerR family transcriptional regulator [Fusobacterium sp.]MDU1910705.1 MerR family transcriptional regulator [Fusobacterium sp.]
MTFDEIKKYYNITDEIIQEYKNWGFSRIEKNGKNNSELEKLKLIMILRDSGFNAKEIENYMKIEFKDGRADAKKMKLLNDKRNQLLDKIHTYEKQLGNLDYIRYEIRKNIEGGI